MVINDSMLCFMNTISGWPKNTTGYHLGLVTPPRAAGGPIGR